MSLSAPPQAALPSKGDHSLSALACPLAPTMDHFPLEEQPLRQAPWPFSANIQVSQELFLNLAFSSPHKSQFTFIFIFIYDVTSD